jgi:hypothetical protein
MFTPVIRLDRFQQICGLVLKNLIEFQVKKFVCRVSHLIIKVLSESVQSYVERMWKIQLLRC